MNELDTADVPALAGTALPPDRNPAIAYLASLTDGPGRTSMRSTLDLIATMPGFSAAACPWQSIRIEHFNALRSTLAEGYTPATANKYMTALRQIARQAWRLGEMPIEEYQRIAAVRNVAHERRPRGRALDGKELQALFGACNDGTPAGARDAAAFAMPFGCGLRRAEAAAVALADYDPASGTLRVGKGGPRALGPCAGRGDARDCRPGRRARDRSRPATRPGIEVRRRAGRCRTLPARTHAPAETTDDAGRHRRPFDGRSSPHLPGRREDRARALLRHRRIVSRIGNRPLSAAGRPAPSGARSAH